MVWDQEGEIYMGMIYLGPSVKNCSISHTGERTDKKV